MGTITLSDLKSKLRAFYKRKFKDLNTNEIALFANGKFKGLCKNCGKQGHKAADCRSKNNTGGANKETKGKGVKCFNCNKYAGHIAKDCPEEKKTKEKKETGMLTTNNKTFFDYEYVEDTKVYTTCEETEYAFIGMTIEIVDEEINLVPGVVDLRSPDEELLQEWCRLLDEDGHHQVGNLLQAVVDDGVLATAQALKDTTLHCSR